MAAVAGLVAVTVWTPRPGLMWNASASMPVGLYAVERVSRVGRGDVVAAALPPAARGLAAARGYLPEGVPLLKRVAAVPGDRICGGEAGLVINGVLAARRRERDSLGRPLPAWRGCGVLLTGLVLLGDSANSFDARYFGPVDEHLLIGSARLIWRR